MKKKWSDKLDGPEEKRTKCRPEGRKRDGIPPMRFTIRTERDTDSQIDETDREVKGPPVFE